LQEIELVIDEDEGVPYKIGDSFYSLTVEEATERMEGEKLAIETEIGKMEENIESIREDLDKLKVKLYGKFGTSINLEK
jgi:prefoldin subunit 4